MSEQTKVICPTCGAERLIQSLYCEKHGNAYRAEYGCAGCLNEREAADRQQAEEKAQRYAQSKADADAKLREAVEKEIALRERDAQAADTP